MTGRDATLHRLSTLVVAEKSSKTGHKNTPQHRLKTKDVTRNVLLNSCPSPVSGLEIHAPPPTKSTINIASAELGVVRMLPFS